MRKQQKNILRVQSDAFWGAADVNIPETIFPKKVQLCGLEFD